jgi:protein-S-isoprenylcysteine O-methyltransferase Ste14
MAEKSKGDHGIHPTREHGHSPMGTALFIAMRLASPFIQYGILHYDIGSHIVHRLHVCNPRSCPSSSVDTAAPISRIVTQAPSRDLPIYRAVLLAMATGASLKHIYWVLNVSETKMKGKTATALGLTNIVFDTVNTVLFTNNMTSAMTGTSQDKLTPPLVVGGLMYVAGIAFETMAEVQRRDFRADTRNEGKVCMNGIWSAARHINYAAYALWRTGFAIAAGGWCWGAVTAVFTLGDFAGRAIPNLEAHLEEKVSLCRSFAYQ